MARKPPPVASRNTGRRITEDDPRWNPATMGNHIQGGNPGVRGTAGKPTNPIPKPKKTVAPTKTKKAPLPVLRAAAPAPPSPLDQLVAMYTQQQAQLQQQQQGQQASLTDFSKQMLNYLNQQPGAINALYQHAVDQTQQFGQTAADQFRAANPNAQVQADLGAIGAGPEQAAKVGGALNSIYGTGGATLYAAGGQIPATELAANQASAGLYANSLPGIQALAAQQAFQALLANQAKDTSAFQMDKTKTLYDAQTQVAKTTGTGTTAAGKAIVRSLANGQLQAFDPYSGKPLGKPYGPTKPLSDSSAAIAKPTVRSLANGQLQAINPLTGGPLGKPYGPVRVKGSGRAPAQKTPTVRQLANGQLQAIDPYTGRPLGAPYGPTRSSSRASGRGASPSSISITVARADKAGTAALNALTAKIWASTPGSGVDPNKDPKGYATAKQNAQLQLTKSFGSAMYRVINAIGPHLKAIGYSPAAVKYKAFQIVSAVIAPPRNYRPPKATGANPKNVSYTISYRGGGGQGLVDLLQAAGFHGEGLRIAYGIALRESGGRPDAFNGNTGTGDRSWGLFQINTLGSLRNRIRQFGLSSEQDLLDPLANARAAYQMSKGGTDFGSWGIGPNAYRAGAGFDTIKRFYDQFPSGYV